VHGVQKVRGSYPWRAVALAARLGRVGIRQLRGNVPANHPGYLLSAGYIGMSLPELKYQQAAPSCDGPATRACAT
jgi:hypothetical protein